VLAARPDGTLDAAAPEGVDTVRADLVIGADGVHSRVRQGGAFGARVGAPGIPYVRAIVPEGLARGEEAWTAAGLFGSFPVPGGTYLYASAGTAACAAAAEAADLEAFRAIWARAYAPAGAMFTSLSSWHDLIVTRVVRVDCDRWVDGRLVLLGDAAHAMAPNLGQGGNSALVDAAVLVDELRRGPDLPSALQAWQVRRQPKVRAVADLSGRLGALAEITHPAARWVRDRVLPPIARMAASRSAGAMVLQEPPAVLAGTVVSRSS
jgi:2-polyprenyl-6-methoxyphenol hydroxylase-like FAD-dependent oxidoreductase